ncbi:galactose-1-phosphate uridylyltransferase [Aureibacillus halotolerans]|uniref:Galactose-1-phosphate uridylyltransferase n=1 Tax=Aureibacillus halotolerans TaxID=1508390 RepID=A0A4R6UEE2_9BACI|nr:galactose-1-phosphate uridylyltransferase [Aureibacillus halotolerans]TDQ41454.1 UDPglucose--hexose-1-phosphate uridylyltransferase [Aureibacillus halotolerans]
MAELRYNPLLDDWTMVSAKRQNRPDMPKDFCPFCPGSGKVPDNYDVLLYPNDFPVLSQTPPEPDDVGGGVYKTKKAYGQCEVILYSPDHQATMPDLSRQHMNQLIDLWSNTYDRLAKQQTSEYVMIFENRGKEVGVTMPHPHGQVYAYPFVPKKVRTELDACKAHYNKTGRNLFDDMLDEEKASGSRVVAETAHFLAYIPFFNDYPYGVYVVAKQSITSLNDMTEDVRYELGHLLQDVVGGMDLIYDKVFPYMMVMHPAPVNDADAGNYYRFHIEFYPPLRGETSIKYNASSETGGWAAANPTKIEDNAPILKAKIEAFQEKKEKGEKECR